jgi:GT2 family glycosyltransferase
VTSGVYAVVRDPAVNASISVVIPTRGSSGQVWGERRCFVVEAVRSVLSTTATERLEIVVVHDAETPPEVLDDLRALAGDALVLVPFEGPFNFSAKCNLGVVVAKNDVVVLLNDDVELVEAASLDRLATYLDEPDVGLVGPRLVYEDGRLQHGGHVYGGDDWFHARLGAGGDDVGPFCALIVSREVSGLTAAFVAFRRSDYLDVGGMSELLPVNFNDVDFSLKVRSAGFRLIWTPRVTAYHFESRTRQPVVHQWEVDQLIGRWGRPKVDPYFTQQWRLYDALT